MLGKKDAADVKINTILGRGSDFQGDVSTNGSARVDGNVVGNVKVAGVLTVGASGVINGTVEARAAVIGGEIVGNVYSQERIELTSTARVLGDISTKVIVIDENAVFQGKCDMNQEVPDAKRSRSASAKAVRAGKKSAKEAIEEALKEVEEEEKREAMNQEPAASGESKDNNMYETSSPNNM